MTNPRVDLKTSSAYAGSRGVWDGQGLCEIAPAGAPMGWKEAPLKRSYACTPDLLVYLRERKQLTQNELAKAAGYSERLISKAESGLPVSAETVAHLAMSLSTDAERIYPEDLITDPIKHAKEYIAAVYTQGKGIVDAIAHFLDEEIVFRVAGDPSELPFAGEHRGIDGLRRMFDLFFSILEAPKDHDYESCYTFLGQGNEVSMTGESCIHPIGRPMDKPIMIAHRFVFSRGKLVLMEDIFDTMTGKKAIESN